MKLSAKGGGDFFRLRFWAAGLLMLGMFLMSGMGEANAATLAGTTIGNQASASYLDSNNVPRVTVSNTVTTTVAQVADLTLTQSQTKSGAPGQPLSYPHTITNTGNGSDSYNLVVQAVTGTSISGIPTIFADANCDGIADNATNIAVVGPVAAGAQACFVVQATLTTVSSGTGTFDVKATSVFTNTINKTNTDTANITTVGVVNVSKSISSASGPAGTTPVTYTLTYRNTGSQPVFGLVIADALQTGVVFAPTLNAKLNGTAINATGTVTGSTPNRANLALSTDNRKIVVVIERVDPNTQGTLTFDTTQNGPGPINNNNAQFCYLDGTSVSLGTSYSPGTLPTSMQPPNSGTTTTVSAACALIVGNAGAANGSGVLSSAGTAAANYATSGGVIDSNVANATAAANPNVTNTVPFNILTTAATGNLVFNDGTTSGGGNGIAGTGNPTDGLNPTTTATSNSQNDTGLTAPDINPIASATQGSVITFGNWVWNTGSASDTYNITAVANNFPSGTTFLFFRGDGTTPLTDSNGDGTIDTGPIPGTGSGASCPALGFTPPNAIAGPSTPCATRIVVSALLPGNASGLLPFDVIVRATSSLTPTTSNTVVDRLASLAGSSVDLKNPRTTTNVYTGGGGGFAQGCATHDLVQPQGTCDAYVTNAGNGQTTQGEAASQTSIAANPAAQVVFKIDVNNTGAIADSFDLAYNVGTGNWSYNGGTNPFATPLALPPGYTLAFFFDGNTNPTLGDCSTLQSGAQITNTGVIAPGRSKLVCAVVTIPAGAQATTRDLFFRAISPTTTTSATLPNSFDVLHDQLVVNTVRSVTITPNNSGQVFPGGSVAYCHTLTNVGNITESNITVTDANNLGSPWAPNSSLYLDTNGNCLLDNAEGSTPFAGNTGYIFTAQTPTAMTLAPGASLKFIVVVQAPPAASAGQTNITTVTATTTGALNGVTAPPVSNATDTTVVVTGQVNLVKTQVLDPTGTACGTGMTMGALSALVFSSAAITSNQAIPGACIIYHVVATNVGTQNVTQVIISDATPPNTTCYGPPFSMTNGTTPNGTVSITPATACATATTASASLSTATVTLAPNGTVDLYLRVRINP
jgi:uncharacterized repeat protein (TIGR01451 family)